MQLYLIFWILCRAPRVGKKLEKQLLEEYTFGNLINYATPMAHTWTEISLVNALIEYKNSRNKLAHKMFTDDELTVGECAMSIKLGHEILEMIKTK